MRSCMCLSWCWVSGWLYSNGCQEEQGLVWLRVQAWASVLWFTNSPFLRYGLGQVTTSVLKFCFSVQWGWYLPQGLVMLTPLTSVCVMWPCCLSPHKHATVMQFTCGQPMSCCHTLSSEAGIPLLSDCWRSCAKHQAHHWRGKQAHCWICLWVCPEQSSEQCHSCAQSQHHVSSCGGQCSILLYWGVSNNQASLLSTLLIHLVSLEKNLVPVRGTSISPLLISFLLGLTGCVTGVKGRNRNWGPESFKKGLKGYQKRKVEKIWGPQMPCQISRGHVIYALKVK